LLVRIQPEAAVATRRVIAVAVVARLSLVALGGTQDSKVYEHGCTEVVGSLHHPLS